MKKFFLLVMSIISLTCFISCNTEEVKLDTNDTISDSVIGAVIVEDTVELDSIKL